MTESETITQILGLTPGTYECLDGTKVPVFVDSHGTKWGAVPTPRQALRGWGVKCKYARIAKVRKVFARIGRQALAGKF